MGVEDLSDRRLKGWYKDYNHRFFRAALPEDIDILYAPIQGCSGDVIDCPAEDFILRINPRYSIDTKVVRMTLLHEMAHIKLWPYRTHGPKFQQEMLRLATLGAFRGLW